MLIGILIAFLLFLLGTLAYSWNNSLFAPAFISNVLWGTFVLLYNITNNGLYPLGEKFYIGILLWSILFTFGCWLIQAKQFSASDFIPSKLVLNIYFCLVLLLAPIAMIKIYQKAAEGPTDILFFNLRLLSTNPEDFDFSLGIYGYVYSLAAISLLAEFLANKGKIYKNIKIIILIILNVGLSILTVSRTSFFFLVVSIFIIYAFKTKVKLKHFVYVFGGIVFLFVGMTFLKDSFDDGVNIGDSFFLYLFSGMAAFETLRPAPEDYDFGANVFRIFYAIGKSMGLHTEPVSNILEYVSVPEKTNVYTFLYPFYRDFGYLGIVIFGFLYGLLFQFMYINAHLNKGYYLLFYSYLVSVLLFQFLGDTLVTNLSMSLQYLIFSLFAFKKLKTT